MVCVHDCPLTIVPIITLDPDISFVTMSDPDYLDHKALSFQGWIAAHVAQGDTAGSDSDLV